MKQQTTFYFYPRSKKGIVVGDSIAVIIHDGRPFVGYARLSSDDQFNRKVGRKIALDRANKQLERYKTTKSNREAKKVTSLDTYGC